MPVRAPYPVRDQSYELLDYIERRLLFQQIQPIWLGGGISEGGGSGGPPGGFIGQLPQTRVCYDLTESSVGSVSPSPSLLDNMNRIRGGWAIADEAIKERHIQWATSGDYSAGSEVEAAHVPFFSDQFISTNVHDALEEIGGSWHGYTIILYRADGSPPTQYTADSSGFDEASTSAGSGDVVWLPCVPIDGNHTLSQYTSYVGVSRQGTKLTGQITLESGTSLENLTVLRTGASDLLRGVVNAGNGTATITNCEIRAVSSGSADAYAVMIENESVLSIWNSYLHGESSGGSGYAAYRNFGAGALNIFGGQVYGSTDEFNE